MTKRGIFDDPVEDPVEDPRRELTASQQQQLTTYDEWFRDNPEPYRERLSQPNPDDTFYNITGGSPTPQFETRSDWERAYYRWLDEKKAWDDWNYANNMYTELREELLNPA